MSDKSTPLGKKIIAGLGEFSAALESGDPLSGQLTCRNVELLMETEPYTPELVRQTRGLLCVSQVIFGQFLGVSTSAVRNWEQGIDQPSRMACRFMDEIRREPERWRMRLGELLMPRNTATG